MNARAQLPLSGQESLAACADVEDKSTEVALGLGTFYNTPQMMASQQGHHMQFPI